MSQFTTMNIFTARPFGGTTLAIVPEADGLEDEQMGLMARELNHSVTAFMMQPQLPGATARLRFFNPAREVDFAGQAIIGVAVHLASQGIGPDMIFEITDGTVAARASGNTAVFTIESRLRILARPELGDVAAALSLPHHAIDVNHHRPVLATVGLPFTLTELKSLRALEEAAPNVEAFRVGHKLYPSSFNFAQYCYYRKDDNVHARMFNLHDTVVEDPATGSAVAALAAFLTALDGNQHFTVHQGDYIGRPSRLQVRSTAKSVSITGNAVPVMGGQLIAA
ncbi:MAG: PhzF family phenazine biosynthesis protein [Vannielia sp.]|uniref:PhzF family phenazine biosynthesis protein n=1 Tax=Rhodobacterales TaxID=204455 RepID=UPI0020947FBA|nr:PhzF family phenazine biosynthesis protein [Oceanicola sp. 502str15]MCO6382377.1 PhzF family phenazine biosynthesis isomerase [Oceanicola sp. 502str15]